MKKILVTLALATLCAAETFAAPMGTAFTYQGRLNDGGVPANNIYDLTFTLHDDPVNVASIGTYIILSAEPVTNGLFTAQLNANGEFGPSAFNGAARWLQIGVRTNSANNAFNHFTFLSPRQPLTPAPCALFASNAVQALTANSANSAVSAQTANVADSVAWANVTGIPAGFADGTDNDTTYSAGAGLTLGGANNQFGVNFAGSGSANTVARSDHGHFGANWSGSSSSFGLTVMNNSTSGNGVYSQQGTGSGGPAPVGYKAALWGESSHGDAVYGASGSSNGTGVYGYATATSGANYGVYGQSDSPAGVGVFARGSGTSGTALKVSNGALRVAGAGTNSSTVAFLHVVTPANHIANAFLEWTVIDNPYCNNDPNALLFVTQNGGRILDFTQTQNATLYYDDSGLYATNRWVLLSNPATPLNVGNKFNFLVIKP